jgi:hypothetical protein
MQLAPPSSDNSQHTNVKPNNGGSKNSDGTAKSGNRDGITRDANGNIIDSTDSDTDSINGSGTDSGIINTAGTGLGSFTLGVVVSYT